MLTNNLTHYAPADQPHDFAYCGVYLSEARYHSPQPTCPDCARKLAEEEALEAAIDEMPFPLDADEAALALEREARRPMTPPSRSCVTSTMSPLGAQLFELAVTLNHIYAAQLRTKRGGQ